MDSLNSFNFILNERGGVLARPVAAGVGLTRSDGQVVEREQGSRAVGIREYSRHLRDQFFQSTTTLYLLIEVLYLLTRSLVVSKVLVPEKVWCQHFSGVGISLLSAPWCQESSGARKGLVPAFL